MTTQAYGTEADLILYSALGVIAIITAMIIWFGVRCAKAQEKQAAELTIGEVLKYYGNKISSNNFLWATWQGRFSIEKMQLFVKDAKGDMLATITYPSIPENGILEIIEMGNKKYECVKSGLLSNKTLLREVGNSEVLISCLHYQFRQEYYQGESERVKFTLHHRSVFHDSEPIKMNNVEVGQLFNMYKFKCDALLLNLPISDIPTIEQLFIFACIPRRR